MDRFVHKLLLSLLLLPTAHVHAESTFAVSPSVGSASINNIDGYKNSPYLRVDGSFFPQSEFGANVFVAGYSGFDTRGAGNTATVKINGYGAGVVGRWPAHPHVQPYIRVDYMRWNAEVIALDRTIAKDKGGSAGLAVGVKIPIRRIFGISAEVSDYNNVSDADMRQFSLGLTLEF